MAMFIPETFTLPNWPFETSVRDFVLALVVGCIMFTTFIKGTTIPYFLKKLQVTLPTSLENIDYSQGRVLFLLRLLNKIDAIETRGFITAAQKEEISKKYNQELEKAHKEFFSNIKDNSELEAILERTLALHALEIEKSILIDKFNHNEVPEWILRRMLNKLDSQIERVEEGKSQIKECYEHKMEDPLMKRIEIILAKFVKKRDTEEERYYKVRIRAIILEKVLKKISGFSGVEEITTSKAFKNIQTRYQVLLDSAISERKELYKLEKIKKLEKEIIKNALDVRKYDILDDLYHSGLTSLKTKNLLVEKYTNH